MGDNQNSKKLTENLDEKLLDHNYDGIQELDNPLPAWWVHLFNITIVFSFFYLIVFLFFIPDAGVRADQRVDKLLNPKTEKAAPGPDAALLEEEPVSVKKEGAAFPDDEDTMDVGKKVFVAKCLACHGAKGEGLVGPNLTDEYWLHGKGTAEDIYQVVVEGVPDKGMISWKSQISDEEIRAVVVYIRSLQGTNPENPKPPQGEKAG